MEPEIRVELAATTLTPESELAGVFVVVGGPPADTRSVELSVLWHTSGKGTEDLGVIHYQSWKVEDGSLATMPNPSTFRVPLPRSPWSYEGELIKIHWVARVRLRWGVASQSQEVVCDAPFVLAPGDRL